MLLSMNIKLKTIVLLCLLAFSVSSHAGYFFSGSRLVEWMREVDKADAGSTDVSYGDVGRYGGYVAAVSDALTRNNILCFPGSVTVGQAMAIVTKFLKANPERWNELGYDLVADALTAAFPC